VAIEVPLGTKVSVAGGVAFTTTERIVVPKGRFGPPAKPGERSAGVVAAEAGTSGNVAAGTIDTVDDASIRALLRGFPDNPNSLVTNLQPTAGGVETPHSVILQSDVDAVVAGLQTDLTSHLADLLAGQPDRVYAAAPASEVPQINLQPDLVGTEDQATFNLTGTLAFNRPYVLGADLKAAARAALERDDIAPQGTSIREGSIQVEPGTATANGDEMTIAVTVRAAAAAAIDKAAVQDRIAGKTVPEAKTALAPLGKVQVALWPNWLDRLPRLPFRIAVVTVAPSDGASPTP
jgi:Baseplate J-like protein